MSLETYEPSNSHSFYEDYYRQQVGNGLQVYTGRRYMPQSGAGLGSLFSGLLRAAAPLAKSLGKRALSTGARIASDVAQGRNFKESAKSQLRRAGVNLLEDMNFAPKTGRNTTAAVSRKRKRQSGKGLTIDKKSRTIF